MNITNEQRAALQRAFQLVKMRDAAGAVALCERIMPRLMKQPRALRIYAIALVESGSYERAVTIIDKAVKLAPMESGLRVVKGKILNQAGRFREAAAELERVLAIEPANTEALEALVRSRRMLRESDAAWEAVAEAEAAGVPATPHFVSALADAALGVKRTAGVSEAIEATLAGADSMDEMLRWTLAFQFGRVLEAEGEYDRAFAAFDRANAMINPPFDPAHHQAAVDTLLNAWSDADLSPLDNAPEDRVVFVVGMPRSGTTLVEQILCAHQGVESAGETLFLPQTMREAGVARPPFGYPASPAALLAPEAGRAAHTYVANLRDRADAGAAATIVDKLPLNVMNIHAAARLFPNATFIACRRDPRDIGLSCYQQFFAGGTQFAYDLGHLGHAIADVDRTIEHAAELLPDRVHVQNYEDVVEDLEQSARGIAEAADLKFDESALRFWESDRRPATASYDQVARPIYTSSVGRWKRYRDHLTPLIETLRQRGVNLPS